MRKTTSTESAPKEPDERSPENNAPKEPETPKIANVTNGETPKGEHRHPHDVKALEIGYCPDGNCSDDVAKSEDFKLEAKCVNCKGPYGRESVAKEASRCPWCGSKAGYIKREDKRWNEPMLVL